VHYSPLYVSSPENEEGEAASDLEERLAAKLAAVPAEPGVYLLKDHAGKVIYVGKAKSLRPRVQSYFRGGDERHQVQFLVRRVGDLECLVTRNEKEALILENNLIKQYKPRYNIRLKDDKSYVSVKITSGDAWPRVLVTRKIARDGSRYFGPFHSASAVRDTLDVIRKVFPLRTCSDPVFKNRTRPCLEFQIKRCLGPCVLPVDRAEYEQHLRAVTLLLEGKDSQLRMLLQKRMQEAAAALRFEDAARFRDQLRAIEKTGQQQGAVRHGGGDCDVFGLYREGGFIEAQVLMIRSGKLTANQSFGFADWELPDEEVLSSLLTQFYQGERFVPDEVLLPLEIDDSEPRAELLRDRKGRAVAIVVPQRGEKVRLIELAKANARQAFLERRDDEERSDKTARELQDKLQLRNPPKRIECVDISTFQGGETVGSVVSFDEGRSDPGRYRRFKIKTVVGTDDFASMREMLERRLRTGLEKNDLPDLLVIDGGRGQLGIAMAVCADLGITNLDVVGLAKMRVERSAMSPEIERLEERVFLPGRVNPVVLARNSSALFLLQRVRDEAHRFAVTYHQKLRDRGRLRSSPLREIAGIGEERRRVLLRHFGSLTRVRAAAIEDIEALPGFGRSLAERIKRALEAEATS
jgi:excinuclease ABC subunit C